MADNLNNLLGQRAALVQEARTILDAAEADNGRDLSAEESQKYEAIMADVDAVRARVERETEIREAEKAVAATVVSGGKRETENDEESKLRQIARGELRSAEFRFSDAELRDQVKATATSGGNTVPQSFVSQLYEHLIEVSSVRQSGASIIRTNSGEDLVIPKTTAHGSAAIFAEAAQITTSDASFGTVTMKAYKYGRIILVSRELTEDTGVDLLGYLARAAGRSVGEAANTHFVTGDNSSKPQGVITGATVGVTAGTTNVITTDELIDLVHSVIAPYRANGRFLMNDATAAHVRKKKDTTNQYIWQPGLVAGQPDRLLGYPVLTDPNVATLALSSKVVAFGDFGSAYQIRDVNGVRFDRSDDLKFDYDMVAFRCLLRTDGRTIDANAVKTLVTPAT